ncbi:uncharacterized protein LY89DRAFT_725777 [Mollisia scopiformis]|uniref:Uncharacterized protein n=1 Tax=Mollisia scopiformis TaxID=149040 RepID=A0A132B6F5_MOLSC|nr:uncharacterized protein LY89DRAFT_725777 [Mollisia scopiformis]KUJ07257.1 hypothetical protein LY89DRAFT_725777 [Mollisia scopiformis]
MERKFSGGVQKDHSSRARAEAEAEAEADNNPSFGSEEPEFLETNNHELEHFGNNNQFEHHTILACVLPNNSFTDFAFDDNAEDEINAKQVMDAFMEREREQEREQERWFFRIVALFFFIFLLFFFIVLLVLFLLGWGYVGYRY